MSFAPSGLQTVINLLFLRRATCDMQTCPLDMFVPHMSRSCDIPVLHTSLGLFVPHNPRSNTRVLHTTQRSSPLASSGLSRLSSVKSPRITTRKILATLVLFLVNAREFVPHSLALSHISVLRPPFSQHFRAFRSSKHSNLVKMRSSGLKCGPGA